MCLHNSVLAEVSKSVFSGDTQSLFVFLSAAVEREYNRDISRVKANHFMKKIRLNIFSVTPVPPLSLISSDDNSFIVS